jgi:hypothetical protein
MNYRLVGVVERLTDRVLSWRFRMRQNGVLARRGGSFVIWLTKVMLGARMMCMNASRESYEKDDGR